MVHTQHLLGPLQEPTARGGAAGGWVLVWGWGNSRGLVLAPRLPKIKAQGAGCCRGAGAARAVRAQLQQGAQQRLQVQPQTEGSKRDVIKLKLHGDKRHKPFTCVNPTPF